MLCYVLCISLFITFTWTSSCFGKLDPFEWWIEDGLSSQKALQSRLLKLLLYEVLWPDECKNLKKKTESSKLSTPTSARDCFKAALFVLEDWNRKAKGRCRRIRRFFLQLEINKSSFYQHYVATLSHYSWRAYSLTKFLISWFINVGIAMKRGEKTETIKINLWIFRLESFHS